MKKVLILRSNAVDPDPRVQKEAEVLLNAGYSVDVFCWDRSSNHKRCEHTVTWGGHKLRLYRTGIKAAFGAGFRKNIIPLIRFQRDIAIFLMHNLSAYNIVHACDFDTCLTGLLCARIKRKKIVYDIFDFYADAFSVPDLLKKAVISLDSFLIRHADAVIICSEQRKHQIKNAKPKKLAVIHNSPAKAERKERAVKTKGYPALRIAYVGILNDGRMIPELLEAVSEDSNYILEIAGYGKYEKLAYEYALKNKNVIFHGKIEYDAALELEGQSDVMIAAYDPSIPNHRYAAPNKFYEALMLGIPLIMCSNTGISDEVERNGVGVCIDYSATSLKNGLEEIRKNYSYFEKNCKHGRQLYDENYSWDIMAERLTTLYSEL